MAYLLEKVGVAKCALDATKKEAFTQKTFADLIYDAHTRGLDFYIARVHSSDSNNNSNIIYSCYEAKQLCKYIFEMVISSEGRKIRIKNFKDPLSSKNIAEINFFKLRYDSETPLRAEFVGNHISFLESSVFRSKLFNQEDALDALSVNFQFKSHEKLPYIKKKRFLDAFLLIVIILLFGTGSYFGIKLGKEKMYKKDFEFKQPQKN